MHGADLLLRPGKLPFVAVADNVDGEVYLSDTTFQKADVLDWPQHGPYTKKQEFHATDVAFGRKGELMVTDGYGKSYVHHYNAKGDYVRTFGGEGSGAGQLKQPHGIWVDARGDIYVGEVTQTSLGNQGLVYKQGDPSLRKFIRVR